MLSIVFVLIGLGILSYLGLTFRAAFFFQGLRCEASTQALPRLSVLVPARNEAENIRQCLEALLAQDYPKEKFEILIINDHSTDRTTDIVEEYLADHPQLSLLHLELAGINAYKKAAINLGVKRAKGTWILQTDADCQMETRWARAMMSQVEPEVGLISGPITLEGPSFFQRLQSLESIGLIALGAGSMAAGSPNMCNGANLAYRKSVFESLAGFEVKGEVASGDDELLLQRIHTQTSYKLRFAKCPEAIVSTAAHKDWSAFRNQRLRWVSKARYYLDKRINLVQLLFYVAFWAFPLSLILGFWDNKYWLFLSMWVALKVLVDFYLMYLATNFFSKLSLLKLFIPLQILYIPYVLWIGIAGNFVQQYQWKGRNVS